VNPVLGDHPIEQSAEYLAVFTAVTAGKMRDRDVNAAVGRENRHPWLRPVLFVDRLFDEEHAVIAGAAVEQMLRALEHEIPTQV
jgi:hypothetical protein